MSRPTVIDDKVILKAARKVFLKDGFKARSSEIAREARVSEGTVFKRFDTKAHLFFEAMRDREDEEKCLDLLAASVGKKSVRQNLLDAANRILDHMEVVIPRMMMLRASGIKPPWPGSQPPHRAQAAALARYFAGEIRRRRLAMREPEAHAHMFVGSLLHYVMDKQIFPKGCCSRSKYVNLLVNLHLGRKRSS